ncbi:MAG: right-handed parallel beta-helix repeat-containing protein [Planctomycetota bacterium]
MRVLAVLNCCWIFAASAVALDSLPRPIAPEVQVTRMYYVDPQQGDDSNDGLSRRTAWKSIARANRALRPGEGVTLLAGEYLDERIEPAYSGEPGKPIVYQGEGAGRTILRAQRARRLRDPKDGLVRFAGRDHIVVQDMELDGARASLRPNEEVACVNVVGSHNVFRRLKIRDANGTGVWFVGSEATATDGQPLNRTERNLVEQCEIYYCCSLDKANPPGTPENRSSAVVHLNCGPGNVVRLCHIHHNGADAIQPRLGGSDFLIEWNDLHGNNEDAIDLKSPTGVTVRYNLIHNNRKEGMVIHDLSGKPAQPLSGGVNAYGNFFVRQSLNALRIAGLTRSGDEMHETFHLHDNVFVCSGTVATVFLVQAPLRFERNLCVVEGNMVAFLDKHAQDGSGGPPLIARTKFHGNLIHSNSSTEPIFAAVAEPEFPTGPFLGANLFSLLQDAPAIFKTPRTAWPPPGAEVSPGTVGWQELTTQLPSLADSRFQRVEFRDPNRLDYRPKSNDVPESFGPNWKEHLGWIEQKHLESIASPASPFEAGHYIWDRSQVRQ